MTKQGAPQSAEINKKTMAAPEKIDTNLRSNQSCFCFVFKQRKNKEYVFAVLPTRTGRCHKARTGVKPDSHTAMSSLYLSHVFNFLTDPSHSSDSAWGTFLKHTTHSLGF